MSQLLPRRLKKVSTIFLLLVSTMVLLCSNGGQVLALSTAQNNLIDSGSLYFNISDDSGLCGGATVDGSITLTGGDNPAKVYNFFVIINHFTPVQAAGIIGNMQYESGVNPLKYEGGKEYKVPPESGPGWGIVQWTPNTKITNYADSVHLPAYELSTQLQFLLKELNTSEKNAGDDIRAATTVEDATRAFQGDSKIGGKYNGYERPKSESATLPDRIAAAKIALSTLGSGSTTVGGGSTTGATDACGASGAVIGSAVQTAINYSWPDYHAAPYLQYKPNYKAAITKAQGAGEYVGGGPNPGIDCGGFITRAMRDSGADPNYNWGPNSPKQGNTDAQKAYLDAHPEKYQNLGAQTTTASLLPGDIAINGSHTYMYVGKQAGFNGNSASASFSTTGQSWRTPMASNTYWSNESGPFIWYRLKG